MSKMTKQDWNDIGEVVFWIVVVVGACWLISGWRGDPDAALEHRYNTGVQDGQRDMWQRSHWSK